jgi:HAD superfamily hydrolase (TIGR01509 family)
MRPAVIFLDDGGVMNDNERRSAEWRRLIGEFLTPRLGGTPEAWGDANFVVFDAQWKRFEAWQAERPPDHYADFFASRVERERWLGGMCERVGVPAPAGDGCAELAAATEAYVIPRVRAAYPEAASAIRALHAAGHVLATASGTLSDDLAQNVTGMGIRACFSGRLYGPDLVQAHKAGPEYYRRIFADAGVEPSEALVVDDAPRALAWAAQAGARTVHVRRGGAPEAPAADVTVNDLSALVELLA